MIDDAHRPAADYQKGSNIANARVAGMNAELELTGPQYNMALTVYVLLSCDVTPELTTSTKGSSFPTQYSKCLQMSCSNS